MSRKENIMSINITKNTAKTAVSATSTQPRDAQGRFTSETKEAKKQIQDFARKLNEKEMKELRYLLMDEIESTAPYIYNFVKDNGVVRTLIRDGALRDCLYLNKGTESYYLFFTSHNSFGFHMSCGGLAEVLNNEDTVKLSTEHDILYWDAIQKV